MRPTPDDLAELIGHVAFRANDADDRQLGRRFEELYDRLVAVEQRLDARPSEEICRDLGIPPLR